jgi:hypothetical protein
MDSIDLAQNRNRQPALVTAVIIVGFHKMWGISLLGEEVLPYHEALCSLKLVS